MSNTITFYLLLTPDQNELLDDIHAIARGLLKLDPNAWEKAHEEEDEKGKLWVATNGDVGRITMHEPAAASETQAAEPGWVELSGFPDGGRVRWVLSHPTELQIMGLSDNHTDKVWGHQRAQQQARLQDWITGRIPQHGASTVGYDKGGFRNLFGGLLDDKGGAPPTELPRVAKPSFAPDDTAQWLYKGKLSNLGRFVEEAQMVLASVAHPEFTSRRLLIRSYQRQGWQTIIPLFFLPKGHGFAGGTTERTFTSVDDVANALYTPLGRYARHEIGRPTSPAKGKTPPDVVYLSRFGELEQTHPDPFNVIRSIARTPGKPFRQRTLEARSLSWRPGRANGLIEYHFEGLPDAAQVFVVGNMVEGGAYRCRFFCTGPRERVSDLGYIIESSLR